MGEGTGLVKMEKEFPDRYFDVGIAEGHAVTFAAGLACEGLIPVCAIYSTFLQRAFDHLVHDCALQGLHVVFAIDRAGLVGADGATHHGVLDICYLRSVQNMVLMAPKDEQELRNMFYSAVFSFTSGPVAFRFPRGESLGKPVLPMQEIPLGKGEIVCPGTDIAILALGTMVNEALKAAEYLQNEGISLEVINPRFVKPLDEDLLFSTFERFEHVITIEDGQAIGGFGSAVAEFMVNKQITNKNLHIMGIPDKFIHHATQPELLSELGLDADGIVNEVKKTVFHKTELY